MGYAKREIIYIVFLNIAVFSYAILGIVTVVLLHDRFWAVTSGFMIANAILAIGKLYFLTFRLYHILVLVLFALSLIYLIICLLWAQNDKVYKSFHLINGVVPLVYICASSMFNFFELEIETEMGIPAALIGVGLAIAIMATIFVGVLSKKRHNKKDYIWLLFGSFCVSLVLAVGLPIMSVSHVNYAFDSSIGVQKEYTVVRKSVSVSSGKYHSTNYDLVLELDGEEINFRVSKMIFEKYQEGEKICLYYHEGALGYPYHEYKLDSVYKYGEE